MYELYYNELTNTSYYHQVDFYYRPGHYDGSIKKRVWTTCNLSTRCWDYI